MARLPRWCRACRAKGGITPVEIGQQPTVAGLTVFAWLRCMFCGTEHCTFARVNLKDMEN